MRSALVVMAWIWAQQAKLAMQGGAEAPEFYTEKLATARFFYARILPQTISLLACLTAGSKPLMEPNLQTA